MSTKPKRLTVGSVCKPKADPANPDKKKSDYIRLRGDMKKQLLAALMQLEGDEDLVLYLESKASQLESATRAVAEGKLSGEIGEKILGRINNIPDWVRFEIVLAPKY